MNDTVILLDWTLVFQYIRQLGSSFLFLALLSLMFIDVITGTYKAIKSGIIDSSIGTSGIIKHSTIVIITIFVYITVRLMNLREVGQIFTLFYIFEYLTSILENLDVLGIPFPDSFKRYFNKMRTKHEIEVIEEIEVEDDDHS